MADIFIIMLISCFISINSEKIAYHNGYKGGCMDYNNDICVFST